MNSPAKANDIRQRLHWIEQTELALREGNVISARMFGEEAKRIGHQIKTKDYTQDDQTYTRFGFTM